MVDLLIKEGRDAVLQALRELATTAQSDLHVHPKNAELEAYAYSITWHYSCLWRGKKLHRLVEKATDNEAQATKLKQEMVNFRSRFDAAMSELRALQKYVKLHGMHANSLIPPWPTIDEPVPGGLAPEALARNSASYRSDLLLEGVAAMLRGAPWTRAGFVGEYHADPLQRLEFLDACQALLLKIEALKRSGTKSVCMEKRLKETEAEAVVARGKAVAEWDKIRQGQPIPPTLWNLAREAIDRRRANAAGDTECQVNSSLVKATE
ncbi:hypothetical protein ACVC7V_11455 [Hydrogenophaga sp. A37]|uniref:hypothetical protein n=1 Tax=Hydrogenophaga sp. A37 TaxID=1945864 RepID=UPI00117B0923|nr:hypothetical protein [Hydrogenophaga sp. A37]